MEKSVQNVLYIFCIPYTLYIHMGESVCVCVFKPRNTLSSCLNFNSLTTIALDLIFDSLLLLKSEVNHFDSRTVADGQSDRQTERGTSALGNGATNYLYIHIQLNYVE